MYVALHPIEDVDHRPRQGGADRGDGRGARGDARHDVQLHAADGDAARRGDLGREGRRGGEDLRPGPGHARAARARSSCTSSDRCAAPATCRPRCSSAPRSCRSTSTARQIARYGLNVADVREVVETAVGGIGRRPSCSTARGASRSWSASRTQLRADAERHRRRAADRAARRARAAVARGPHLGDPGARGDQPRERRAAARGADQRARARRRQLRGRGAARVDAARCRCRPATGSSGAASSRTRRAPRPAWPWSCRCRSSIIFLLLFVTFGRLRQAGLVLLNVPFALVGGIAALWLRGLTLNLSASVGFIALFGVAVLNGVVLVTRRQPAARGRGRRCGDAVLTGAVDAAAAGADDGAGGGARLRADGALARRRRRDPAAARQRRDRRRRHLDAADADGAADAVRACSSGAMRAGAESDDWHARIRTCACSSSKTTRRSAGSWCAGCARSSTASIWPRTA